MILTYILVLLCSIFFFMIGADKFLSFLEPACSLQESIPGVLWKVLGVVQLASGILIWFPKFRKYTVGFWFVFMLIFTVIHLSQSTYDIGGSLFMAALLGLLVWNPNFMRSKSH